jgi:hypothetical protein
MPFPGIDRSCSDDDKEERLCIAVTQQPPLPIGRINQGWRWDWLWMRMPFAEVGTGCFACRPRRVDRRLMSPLGAMEPVASHATSTLRER